MKKILIYTDNHFSEKSSILNNPYDEKCSRLNNQLNTLKWLHKTAIENNCTNIICLGDFFDQVKLTDLELTALSNLKDSFDEVLNKGISYEFLVGNHESSVASLDTSCANIFKLLSPQVKVFSKPEKVIVDNKFEICYLPYQYEASHNEGTNIVDFFGNKSSYKRIVLSHNDLANVQYGVIKSKWGFSIESIQKETDLFLNGHLHNGTNITDKIINLGNITGNDFGEDAFKFSHNAMILTLNDNSEISYILLENPYAFNFYKIKVDSEKELENILNTLKTNAVVQLSCSPEIIGNLKEMCSSCSKIIKIRYNSLTEQLNSVDNSITNEIKKERKNNSIDESLKKISDYLKERIGESTILGEELSKIENILLSGGTD